MLFVIFHDLRISAISFVATYIVSRFCFVVAFGHDNALMPYVFCVACFCNLETLRCAHSLSLRDFLFFRFGVHLYTTRSPFSFFSFGFYERETKNEWQLFRGRRVSRLFSPSDTLLRAITRGSPFGVTLLTPTDTICRTPSTPSNY